MEKALSFAFMLYIVALSKCDFTIEIQAEDGISTEAEKMYRSNAKNGIAALIKQGASITLFFQVTGNDTCRMQVGNLRYSNDGAPDEFTLILNKASSTVLGSIRTREASSNGELWNDFQDTGPIGGHTSITEGLYNLVIEATIADEHGVEVDYVSFQILDCNNSTTSVSVVKSGYIRYQECSVCEPCEKLVNYGIGTVVTGTIACCIAIAAIFVTIILKCWDRKKERKNMKLVEINSNI
uniref:Uncharacterized protein n=1 Tax=Amphimedon queenslandica TaxID=400682 RepID=A0A1X7VNU6_AMPQE